MFSKMLNNETNMSGRISSLPVFDHIGSGGEDLFSFTVSSNRLSRTADDIIIITTKQNADVVTRIGTVIDIYGFLQTYNEPHGVYPRLRVFVFAQDILLNRHNDYYHKNQVVLNGYLCKKPTLRKTPLGRIIVDFLLAVNTRSRTYYIPCIAWGKNAESIGDFNIGDALSVTGRIQSRIYEKRLADTVEDRVAYELSASQFSQFKQ